MPAPEALSPDEVRRFRAFVKDETDGAALYRMLAEATPDEHLRELFTTMAGSEDRHRALWEEKLREHGEEVPQYGISPRVRVLGWLARRFGTGVVTPVIGQMEVSAQAMYDVEPHAVAAGLPADERSHARIFRALSQGRPDDNASRSITLLEGRHRGGAGNALRAAVLGVNDGLVSTLSLVFGVAGADPGRDVVLLTGIAGLLAGSLSMALGEWISVRSSAESFERQIAIERDELTMFPEEEEEELALIYRAKGLAAPDAARVAQSIMSNREIALDTLAREELGMAQDEAGSAWVAAVTSFLLFAGGGSLPVLPWIFVGGANGVVASGIAAGLGLFLAGAATSLFTGRRLLFSGGRMLAFGLAAAGVTFAIGRAIGVSTGV